jgi:translation initiation factor 2B subunit (eIF-2B alpha/beta/delta family)
LLGSAVVAMMAHTHHIPVLICSETHKFHERVELDAICNNELESPGDLIAHGMKLFYFPFFPKSSLICVMTLY